MTPQFLMNDKVFPLHVLFDTPWRDIPKDGWLLCTKYNQTLHNHRNSVYHGTVLIGKKIFHAWEKKDLELNPKIVLDRFCQFLVVRDDLLPGGTKQRAHNFFNTIPNHEVVYAGPWNGFAQVALSISSKVHKKRAVFFATRDDYKTNIRAQMYGCKIHVIPHATLKELQEHATKYSADHNAYLMNFGFDSVEFRRELLTSLRQAMNGTILHEDFKKTIWLAAGSGTLLKVLYDLFPQAKFGVVQVGKRIKTVDSSRTKLFIAPERFYQEAEIKPPYPSVATYDAKVWRFAYRYGTTGDVIWNVAGDSGCDSR